MTDRCDIVSFETAAGGDFGGLLANTRIRVSKRIGDCLPGGWRIPELVEEEKGESTDALICVGHAGYYPWHGLRADVAQDKECCEPNALTRVPCDLAKLRHRWSCAGAKSGYHDCSNGPFGAVFEAETAEKLYVFESSREARIEGENAVFCLVVIQALNEQWKVISPQDDNCVFLSPCMWLLDPLDHGEPFVRRFGWALGCDEAQQTYHRDRHDNREYQKWASAPHGLSMA